MKYSQELIDKIIKCYNNGEMWHHRQEGVGICKDDMVLIRYKQKVFEHPYYSDGSRYRIETITYIGCLKSAKFKISKEGSIEFVDYQCYVYSRERDKFCYVNVNTYDINAGTQIFACSFTEEEVNKKYNNYLKKREKQRKWQEQREREQQIAKEKAERERAEAERLAKEKAETEKRQKEVAERLRKEQIVQITVGEWESVLERLKTLEKELERVVSIAEDVDWRTTNHSEEE